ncbi:MAG: fumarylacetoacetate hydrolase family protein [Ignavibacteriaceae bacterium]|nr:fumarylacetoacetate hydrolase family protein [Ignavibacteriaceae bacterium]
MKKVYTHDKKRSFEVGKIVCVGRNYMDHIKELGHQAEEKPVLFLKPTSAMIYSGEKVIYPSFSSNLHHEIELVLLIGKKITDVSIEEASKAIFGFGIGLDMTLRDLQNQLKEKGNPWTISKCFDTSAVISDFILKEDYDLNFEEIISLKVNGKIRQKETLNKMMFKPDELVSYISSRMTLEEGDLIFTGTPSGVSNLNKGDKLEGEITNVAKIETEIV